ncbi:hypothetical protein BJ875DRAFT_108811 [Amylocarpus encephaloides]|uniref:Nuclear distribution protein RO10 n=1 Tax=Amylocarpus encephaloides TaxID=45428 RepID=A0A9P7YQQ7_9HELO|nr:hypothetical protein BJ875DRAFT_108811 [Amylocarpus encephaloides]
MENTFDKTALETIDLLEARLKRIEFAVCGHVKTAIQSQKRPVVQRMSELEHTLHQLASRSRVVQELLKLHARYPDLFQQIPAHEVPTSLDTSSTLSIVLASATSYSSTASQLTSVKDTPIPPAELSAQLINLQPRISNVSTLQAAQSADIAKLRERSAAVVQQWYQRDVLGAGEDWAELEGRVGHVEQRVRRVALARKIDDTMV